MKTTKLIHEEPPVCDSADTSRLINQTPPQDTCGLVADILAAGIDRTFAWGKCVGLGLVAIVALGVIARGVWEAFLFGWRML